MRYLLALLCSFVCITASARSSFSIAGRTGLIPFTAPAYTNDYDKNHGKTSLLFGLKLAYEDSLLQLGLSFEGTTMAYGYTMSVAGKPVSFDIRRPVFNPMLHLNFKTSKRKKHIFFGICGGIFAPGKEDAGVSYNGSPVHVYSYNEKTGRAGFCFGAQMGGQLAVAPHFYVQMEAGARYAGFETKVYDIRYDPYAWGSTFYGSASTAKTSVFYFPLIISLKYEF